MKCNGRKTETEICWKSISESGGRSRNEDCVGFRQKGNTACFVLADGLGGHRKGEVASSFLVNMILTEFEADNSDADFLHKTLAKAQKLLLQKQYEEGMKDQMMSTVVCLVIAEDFLQWAYCGDSRLYYFDKRKLACRTLDHSVAQMLALSGQIKERQIRFHEDRNRLLRAMGMSCEKVLFEVMPPVSRKSGQCFLLCTDGFWEYILEKEMTKCLRKASSVQDWLAQMEQIVLENASTCEMDNYSAIAVWI